MKRVMKYFGEKLHVPNLIFPGATQARDTFLEPAKEEAHDHNITEVSYIWYFFIFFGGLARTQL